MTPKHTYLCHVDIISDHTIGLSIFDNVLIGDIYIWYGIPLFTLWYISYTLYDNLFYMQSRNAQLCTTIC